MKRHRPPTIRERGGLRVYLGDERFNIFAQYAADYYAGIFSKASLARKMKVDSRTIDYYLILLDEADKGT